MSFATRLADLLREVTGSDLDPAETLDTSDDRLAVAALLVHVARIDGKIDGGEHGALLELLGSDFGLTPAAAGALVARADRFDLEVDDVSALVEMLRHSQHGHDRTKLLSMAYRVAAADGVVQEFEDDLVWRLGHLLGLDDSAIAAVRADVVGPPG